MIRGSAVPKVAAAGRLTEVVATSPRWAFGRAIASGVIAPKPSGVWQDGPTQELFVFRRRACEWKIARLAFSSIGAPQP